MDMTMFLVLLLGFSTLSTLVVEAVKKICEDKVGISYNMVALISSLIVGGVGTMVYYQLNNMPFTTNNIICAVLMGLATGLTAMVGYDKVKETIMQFGKTKMDV